MNRLMEQYRSDVRPILMKEFGYSNVHSVPRLSRIVVNMGIGKARENPKEF